eukprot:TRINITY_DN7198_c0_g1_i1.p1 TRINITY_DN7198_c0_g1~~TRINITY_DN7198_c0_g1_i1.p1  ORF type:complete len:531 (+),score=87.06 TRINITY_DN7198_c0_g1_i1:401-1993(+)
MTADLSQSVYGLKAQLSVLTSTPVDRLRLLGLGSTPIEHGAINNDPLWKFDLFDGQLIAVTDTGSRLMLDRLPDAVLQRVLAFLPSRTNVLALTRVCKRLRGAVCINISDMNLLGKVTLGWQQAQVIARFSMLRVLELTNVNEQIDDVHLLSIATSCSRLRTFTLATGPKVTDTGLYSLVSQCVRLEVLVLENCAIEKIHPIGIFCSSLKRLSLAGARNIDDISVERFTKIARCAQLQVINLSRTHVGDCSIQSLQLFSSLRQLVLSGCDLVTDNGVDYIVRQWSTLNSLDIGACSVTDDALKAVGKLPGLFDLSVRGCTDITDQGIEEFAQSARLLRSIHAEGCWQLSDQSLTYISQNSAYLQKVDMSLCGAVSSIGVVSLAAGCVRLREVVLIGYPTFSDDALIALSRCRALKVLQLTHCRRVTGVGLQALGAGCPQMEHLSLGCAPRLLDADIENIARMCMLRHISIHDLNPRVGDFVLGLLAGAFPWLQTVELSGRAAFSDGAIANVKSRFQHVKLSIDVAVMRKR